MAVSLVSRRRVCSTIGTAVLAAAWPQLTSAQLFGRDRTIKYRTFRDPADRFQVDRPEKDWREIPLSVTGSNLAAFQHKDGASFVIEHERLTGAFTNAELEALPAIELDRLRNQGRAAKDFKTDTVKTGSGRGILITFYQNRQGPERVTQCTVVIGLELYRLSSVVPEKTFERLGPVVLHMIESFKAPADPKVPAK